MALEELNLFLGLPAMMWFFIAIAVAIGFTIAIMVHEFFIMTPFAKKARGMKRAKGLPALIQENNVLRLFFSDGQLPEGLFHIHGNWFVRPQRPCLVSDMGKGHVGRPTKEEQAAKTEGGDVSGSKLLVLKPDEREALEEVLQVPILEGVGKPLFIGCVNQPLLMNPATVAHANIPVTQEVLPATYSQTILDALHEYSVLKGIKKAGKEQTKILILAIAAAIVLGTMGIVAYMLMQRPPATSASAIVALLRLIKL